MKTLAKLVILNLVGKIILQTPQIEITFPISGLHLTQDVEFVNCPTVPRVPDFTYMDLPALSVAVLYNSTKDIEAFLNTGCDINDARTYRSEIKTECDNPLFTQLGIECK